MVSDNWSVINWCIEIRMVDWQKVKKKIPLYLQIICRIAKLQQMTRPHELDMLLEKSSALISFLYILFSFSESGFKIITFKLNFDMGENLSSTTSFTIIVQLWVIFGEIIWPDVSKETRSQHLIDLLSLVESHVNVTSLG